MDPKTIFVIAVTTARMIMPGMPNMSGLPGGMKIPGFGEPTRELRMDLNSDKVANASSKAECAIPAGLQLGPKVNLIIDLPSKETAKVQPSTSDGEKIKPEKFTMKYYWMCAETVPAGQPKIIDSSAMGLTPGRNGKVDMSKAMRSYQAPPEGSHAYWPGGKNPIKEESHCPGSYALTTNYCGGTDFTLSPAQDFLAPIELKSPGADVDLAKTIMIDWEPVPNALAYLLTAFGSKEHEMITWTSAADSNVDISFAYQPVSPDEVKKYIDEGILLPPDKTSCRIPAGIFVGCQSPMLTVMAIGTDKTQVKDGITTRITVRSTATAMLGAPGMVPAADKGEQQDQSTVEQSNDQQTQQPTNQPAPQPQPKPKNPFGKLKDLLKK